MDNISSLEDLSFDNIINVMKNATGLTNMGEYNPAVAFDFIIKKQLQKLESLVLNYVRYVYKKLMSIVVNIENEFSDKLEMDFDELKKKIIDFLSTFPDKSKKDSINEVNTMMNYQKSFINTNDPEFIKDVIMSDKYVGKSI